MARSEHEIRIFERFRESYEQFPQGEVEFDCESPDFLVRCTDKTIGIEHTDLYWNQETEASPFQEGESLRKRIVGQLRNLIEQSDLPPVWVAVFFNDKAKYSKKSVGGIANDLFELVKRYLPESDSITRLGVEYCWNELPDEVHEFEIRRIPEIDFVEVSAPEAAWIPGLKKPDLARAAERKELKLSAYQKRADEVWLLISIDSGSIATWYTDTNPNVYEGFVTRFDRIFVLWVVSGIVVELGLASR